MDVIFFFVLGCVVVCAAMLAVVGREVAACRAAVYEHLEKHKLAEEAAWELLQLRENQLADAPVRSEEFYRARREAAYHAWKRARRDLEQARLETAA